MITPPGKEASLQLTLSLFFDHGERTHNRFQGASSFCNYVLGSNHIDPNDIEAIEAEGNFPKLRGYQTNRSNPADITIHFRDPMSLPSFPEANYLTIEVKDETKAPKEQAQLSRYLDDCYEEKGLLVYLRPDQDSSVSEEVLNDPRFINSGDKTASFLFKNLIEDVIEPLESQRIKDGFEKLMNYCDIYYPASRNWKVDELLQFTPEAHDLSELCEMERNSRGFWKEGELEDLKGYIKFRMRFMELRRGRNFFVKTLARAVLAEQNHDLQVDLGDTTLNDYGGPKWNLEYSEGTTSKEYNLVMGSHENIPWSWIDRFDVNNIQSTLYSPHLWLAIQLPIEQWDRNKNEQLKRKSMRDDLHYLLVANPQAKTNNGLAGVFWELPDIADDFRIKTVQNLIPEALEELRQNLPVNGLI